MRFGSLQRNPGLPGHLLQSPHGDLREFSCVFIETHRPLRPAVIPAAVTVAAGPLRQNADEIRMFLSIREQSGQVITESSAGITGNGCRSEIVHRIVAQNGQQAAVCCPQGHDRKVRVSRSGRSDMPRTQMSRMHVRPNRPMAERICLNVIRSKDPAAAVIVIMVLDNRPADFRRHHAAAGHHDAFGDPVRQKSGVSFVRPAAQTGHHGRGRMSVCCGDQNVVFRNSRMAGHHLPHVIEQRARDHQIVDHGDGQTCPAVVENPGAGHEPVDGAGFQTFREIPVGDDRKLRRCDVHGEDSRPERTGRCVERISGL